MTHLDRLFDIKNGMRIDRSVMIITGTAAPETEFSGETISQGSLYLRNEGTLYRKTGAGDTASDWTEITSGAGAPQGAVVGGAWEYVKTVNLNQGLSVVDLGISMEADDVYMLVGTRIVKANGGANNFLAIQFNDNELTTDYEWSRTKHTSTASSVTIEKSTTSGNIRIADMYGSGTSGSSFTVTITPNTNSSWTTVKTTNTVGDATGDISVSYDGSGILKSTAQITKVELRSEDATNIAGTVHVYRLNQSTIADLGTLKQFSGVSLWDNTTRVVSNDNPYAIPFANEYFDTDDYHDTVTNNTRITIQEDGYYSVKYGFLWNGTQTGGIRRGYIRVNGTNEYFGEQEVPESTGGTITEGGGDLFLNAGDYIEAMAYQSSGSNQNINGSSANWAYARFSVYKIGGLVRDIPQFSGVKVRRIASQSIANTTTTEISFDTLDYEVDGEYYNSGTSTTDVIIPEDGYYDVDGAITWTPNTTGTRVAYIRLDGDEIAINVMDSNNDGGTVTCNHVHYSGHFTAGASITLAGLQASGGNLNTSNASGALHLDTYLAVSRRSGSVSSGEPTTFEQLNSNGDVGTGADQVAAGDHTHTTTDITSGTFADARIAQSNVTQHQAALTITESQISDLQSYLLDTTDTFTGVLTVTGSAAIDNITVDGNSIVSSDTNGSLSLTPNGTGDLILDGLKWPQTDGTADYVLKTDGAGQLSWTEQTGGGGGSTASIQAFEDLAINDLVNIFDDSGTSKIRKAKADDQNYYASGYVKAAVTAGNNGTVYFDGINNQYSGLTIGEIYYLHINPGTITPNPVSGENYIVQEIGQAISATELMFHQRTPILLSS